MNDATCIAAALALEAPPATRRAARSGKSPAQVRRFVAIAISFVMIGITVTALLVARPRGAASGELSSPSTGRGDASEPATSTAAPTMGGPFVVPALDADREGAAPRPETSTTVLARRSAVPVEFPSSGAAAAAPVDDATANTTAGRSSPPRSSRAGQDRNNRSATTTAQSPQVSVRPDETPTEDTASSTEPGWPDVAPLESSFQSAPSGTPLAGLPDPVCGDGASASDLTAFFSDAGDVVGVDYQRAYPLPSGRVLWLFQDAFLATSHGPELVHNVGLLQSGNCFQLLRKGSADSPWPYLFPELTDRYDRWFWPLGGDTGHDGNLHVFVAEMREHGSGYLQHTEPVATWLVTIDPVDLAVLDQRLAPNSSHELYGWSVVSHTDHTYLYAHCYRQFGWDPFPFADPPFRAHDWTCGPNVTVARVPRGQFCATPEYWNGSGWTDDPSTAAPVFPRDDRPVNPAQVAVHDGRFVAVTKVGDWWGHTIHLDTAAAPHGPWQTYQTIDVTPRCDVCNTYFASIVPFGADDRSFVIGLSNNTWGGHDLEHYVPTFHRVVAPGPNRDLERCVPIPPGAPNSDGCSPAPIDAQSHETSQPTPQEART